MSVYKPIAVETFFALPRFSRAQISPDGFRIAYLAPWRGRLNIFVRDAKQSDVKNEDARPLTADDSRNIEFFCWAPDSAFILYLQDAKGTRIGTSFVSPLMTTPAPARGANTTICSPP